MKSGCGPRRPSSPKGEATAYPIHIPDEFELSDEAECPAGCVPGEAFPGRFHDGGHQILGGHAGAGRGLLEEGSRIQADRARVYQRHFRHQPAARQHGFRGYVRLAGYDAGGHPCPPGDAVRDPCPPGRAARAQGQPRDGGSLGGSQRRGPRAERGLRGAARDAQFV